MESSHAADGHYPDSRPWTRWWWFANPIRREDLAAQLDWLRDMGFGGVEIAWVYPQPGQAPGVRWLSPEWSELTAFASHRAESIGLGCDFTFGTLWPFGGSAVGEDDAAQNFDGPSQQRLRKSWEAPIEGRILNHLDASALERYADAMATAIAPALTGGRRPAFFCDSWEIRTEGLWSTGFGDAFRRRFGYAIEPLMRELDAQPDARYDYRKLIGEFVLREFYQPYAALCRRHGGFARVQCHGAPTDLLAAYAAAEVPESESLLFDPEFSQIAASAATLAGRPVVSAEAFTCLYGWNRWPGPAPHQGAENIGDIRLLGDALIANGVNHLIWHGTPFQPRGRPQRFYASVHVGPDASFAGDLPDCNRYFTAVCGIMREGVPLTDLAVYLPLEDQRMAGRLPQHLRKPSGEHNWELHHLRFPAETAGRQPTWVSGHFLRDAEFSHGRLRCGQAVFSSLYLDCAWLDGDALDSITRLVTQGLPLCLKRRPRQPGRHRSAAYEQTLDRLIRSGSVAPRIVKSAAGPPVLSASKPPPFRCRVADGELLVFLAHPRAAGLAYPLEPEHFRTAAPLEMEIAIHWADRWIRTRCAFGQAGSRILRVSKTGAAGFVEVADAVAEITGRARGCGPRGLQPSHRHNRGLGSRCGPGAGGS
jgi:hypothetical protein